MKKKEQIKVRQPLKKLMVSARNIKEKNEIELIKDQLCSEINIKEVKVIDDESNILIKEIKPNLKIFLKLWLLMGTSLFFGTYLQQASLLYTNIANAAFFTVFYVPFVPILLFINGRKVASN